MNRDYEVNVIGGRPVDERRKFDGHYDREQDRS